MSGKRKKATPKPHRVHCCDEMRAHLEQVCEVHALPYDCPDHIVVYVPKFDEYGLIMHDGGTSFLAIAYCPWCGNRLPESKRDLRFETLGKLGYRATLAGDDIPEEFRSDAWWAARYPTSET
jgi:hypothetical protein